MTSRIDRLTRRSIVAWLAFDALYVITSEIATAPLYKAWSRSRENFIDEMLLLSAFNFVGVPGQLPSLTFAVLFFAETVRLRLCSADFLLHANPRAFNLDCWASSYRAVVEEWEAAQTRFGAMVASYVLLASAGAASVVVETYYYQILDRETAEFHVINWRLLVVALTAYLSWLLLLLCLVLWAMARANSHAENIGLRMTAVLATADAEVNGVDALRMAAVTDRRPCELTVLGRRINPVDVIGAVALVALAQLAARLGFYDVF